MTFIQLDDLPVKTVVAGFDGRMIHTENLTLVSWSVQPDAELPPHQHPHEQLTVIQEGEFEMTVGDETRLLGPGSVAVIPGGVAHTGRALTPCRIVDVFYPARDDYR